MKNPTASLAGDERAWMRSLGWEDPLEEDTVTRGAWRDAERSLEDVQRGSSSGCREEPWRDAERSMAGCREEPGGDAERSLAGRREEHGGMQRGAWGHKADTTECLSTLQSFYHELPLLSSSPSLILVHLLAGWIFVLD